MPRSFSIVRRRPNIVDLTIRKRAGKIGYRFSGGSNFDASFTAFQTISNNGFRTPDVPEQGDPGSYFRDQVRFLFNPNFYTVGNAAVRDDVPFWVRVEAQNPDGSFDAAEAFHIILPYNSEPNRSILIGGTVPVGAALANSIEVQLPMACNDFRIRNSGAAALQVAFERGGAASPEFEAPAAASLTDDIAQSFTTISQLFLRSVSSTTTVEMLLTMRNNPFSH